MTHADTGVMDWADADSFCVADRHQIWFSPHQDSMYVYHARPWTDSLGVTHSGAVYVHQGPPPLSGSWRGILPPRDNRFMTLSLNDHLSDKGIDKWVTEIGCTSAPVPRQNIRTALAFFAREMPRLAIADAVAFLVAMDLSKPVHVVTLQPGERLIGFRTGTESPFKLFFARRGASMHSSGINPTGRGPVHFVVRAAVRALDSSTTGAKDTWSRTAPGQPSTVAPRARKWFGKEFGVLAQGGGGQLIIPESYSELLVEGH